MTINKNMKPGGKKSPGFLQSLQIVAGKLKKM